MLAYTSFVSQKLKLTPKFVEAVLRLLEEGSTIPFIARYRKDQTGDMDEVAIAAILEEAKFQEEFHHRKDFIEKAITEQGKMTEEIAGLLGKATTLPKLEDIYLPFKPRKRTKAQVAREHGLEPLALLLLEQKDADIEAVSATFFNEAILTTDDALKGARDIIAEMVNEDAAVRNKLRLLLNKEGLLMSKVEEGKETDGAKYKDYFDYTEPVSKVPAHRALAVQRGFKEGFLRISITPDETTAILLLEAHFLQGSHTETPHIRKAIKDAWKRLLQPSLETEYRTALIERSDEEAIGVFADNLRQLLLGSPLGEKNLLALDPGYRTGCKTVVLDRKGDLQTNTIVFVHEPNRLAQSAEIIRQLVEKYKVEAIAIGDGTAGREAEKFVKDLNLGLPVFLVNEDGASIYSASEVAREEFPEEDITVRGAVSIGRRLMDPLAELVKIDPKSIGVGQYQHDVNQVRLKEKLDQTVQSCVNLVGVNLNTASRHLLSYVSGIGDSLAKNIVSYRADNGSFNSRQDLKKVARLGDKAFEQCAGFLRINGGKNPLDNTGVHPESYEVVNAIAANLQVTVQELVGNEDLLKKVEAKKYTNYGELRVKDILKELMKPGLDPRAAAETFEFANIYSIEEVVEGMLLPGVVTNITKFGAFVDIGVKQDGLVHVSEIANRYITDPAEVLKLGQKLMVKVLEVDKTRKRIALSIKQATENETSHPSARKQKPEKPVGKPKAEAAGEMNMQDALALLKSRFGK